MPVRFPVVSRVFICIRIGKAMIQRLLICWLIVSGTIHILLEGYFGLRHRAMAGESSFFGQLCEFSFRQCVH